MRKTKLEEGWKLFTSLIPTPWVFFLSLLRPLPSWNLRKHTPDLKCAHSPKYASIAGYKLYIWITNTCIICSSALQLLTYLLINFSSKSLGLHKMWHVVFCSYLPDMCVNRNSLMLVKWHKTYTVSNLGAHTRQLTKSCVNNNIYWNVLAFLPVKANLHTAISQADLSATINREVNWHMWIVKWLHVWLQYDK